LWPRRACSASSSDGRRVAPLRAAGAAAARKTKVSESNARARKRLGLGRRLAGLGPATNEGGGGGAAGAGGRILGCDFVLRADDRRGGSPRDVLRAPRSSGHASTKGSSQAGAASAFGALLCARGSPRALCLVLTAALSRTIPRKRARTRVTHGALKSLTSHTRSLRTRSHPARGPSRHPPRARVARAQLRGRRGIEESEATKSPYERAQSRPLQRRQRAPACSRRERSTANSRRAVARLLLRVCHPASSAAARLGAA
jgi:hypothetical protein